eukprot:6469049-Amphidinium_carterae.1
MSSPPVIVVASSHINNLMRSARVSFILLLPLPSSTRVSNSKCYSMTATQCWALLCYLFGHSLLSRNGLNSSLRIGCPHCENIDAPTFAPWGWKFAAQSKALPKKLSQIRTRKGWTFSSALCLPFAMATLLR